MPKHYHVISGMPGFMPNTNDYHATKREAEAGARWWVQTFRDDGESWRGNARHGGYWRATNSPFTAYYIEVVACDHDCDPDPCY